MVARATTFYFLVMFNCASFGIPKVKIFKKLQNLKNAVHLCRVRSPQGKETIRSFHFWSFNTNKWIVDPINWPTGLSLLQPDEKARIKRFILEVDQKRALIGRLLIRASVAAHTKQPYKSVKLIRTRANKPILDPNAAGLKCQFSISHHGDWVVLASHPSMMVGVDVLNYEPPLGCKSISEFFDLMPHYFTKQEWSFIKAPKNISMQLRRLYRHWALKESFIKATGEGMSLILRRINFKFAKEGREQGCVRAMATLDKEPLSEWHFVVLDLDPHHCVAIAVNQTGHDVQWDCPQFREVSFKDLVDAAAPPTHPPTTTAKSRSHKKRGGQRNQELAVPS